MHQFPSIKKLDRAILYLLELAASLSILLLAFGLIASMTNVLTKGSVLSDNLIMQRIWAWTQCIAIDASVAGTIIRTCEYYYKRDWINLTISALLSLLLLFTAAIVSNIESVQQTLNVSLTSAYTHVFIPVEALIWIRSVAIVLLIVAHALRYVQPNMITQQQSGQTPLVFTPELISELRILLAQTQTTITEEEQGTPQITQGATGTEQQEAVPVTLVPDVTREEQEQVIAAYRQGIPKRKICSHLHWGSAKYTTIVKPVLDAYEQQEQQISSDK